MKKAIALLGLVTLALAVTLTSCTYFSDAMKGDLTPESVTFISTNAKGDMYELVITAKAGSSKAAALDLSGGNYTLTITIAASGEKKVSTGIVQSSNEGALVLLPADKTESFQVAVSTGGDITAITGTVTFDDASTVDGATLTDTEPEQSTESTDAARLQGTWQATEVAPALMRWVFEGDVITWSRSPDGVAPFTLELGGPGTFVLDETTHTLTLTFASYTTTSTYSFTDDTTLVLNEASGYIRTWTKQE
jgi:hypothetical protein